MRYNVLRILAVILWLILMLWVMGGCRSGGTLVLSTTIQGVDVEYTVVR